MKFKPLTKAEKALQRKMHDFQLNRKKFQAERDVFRAKMLEFKALVNDFHYEIDECSRKLKTNQSEKGLPQGK